MSNWVNWILVIAGLVALKRGWSAGFLASIFGAIGFVGGGLAGLYAALHYFHRWSVGVSKFALLLVAISVGSWVGEALLKRVAKVFHNKFLFGPFKWIDSVLGAAFSLLRTAVMALVIAHLLLITPWSWAAKNIPSSQIYTKLNSFSPTLIQDITKKAESIQ